MRPTFSDLTVVRVKAKRAVDSGKNAVARWWSKKYNLPSNHKLFLERTLGDLHQEMVEDLLVEKTVLEKRIEDGEDSGSHLFRQLNEVNRALGERESFGDALWDKWEREIAEGKIPDLDEMPPGAED